MAQPTISSERFAELVQWAHHTLPEKIRNLPDLPGIQVADEPPEEMFQKMSKRRNWPRGTELLGCYSGVSRTNRQHNLVQTFPDLIFVFRGPILRCSKGNLPAEVKQAVWHEVAHWLGHDEGEVKELGLSRSFKDIALDPHGSEAPITVSEGRPQDTIEREEEANEQPRCIKCHSSDISCHDVKKPFSYPEANSFDPITVSLHSRICTCNSCGYEWDDEDNT